MSLNAQPAYGMNILAKEAIALKIECLILYQISVKIKIAQYPHIYR